MKTNTLLLVSLLVSVIYAAPAGAGGFSAARFGGEHGHPASDNPTVTYFNPAAMTLAEGHHIYVEGILVQRTASYFRTEGAIDHPGEGTPDDAIDANSGRATLSNIIASPFVGAVSDLGMPDVRVGASFSVPFGGQLAWDRNQAYVGNTDYPGAEDGVQRWHVIEASSRLLFMTAAGAYRIRPAKLSVGLSLNLIRGTLETVRARTPQATDDLVVAGTDTLLEGRSWLKASGWLFSVGLGVLYQPMPGLDVGLSYQSQPNFGEYGLKGTLTNRFNTISDTEAELRQSYPDTVRAGVRWRRGVYEVRVSGDFTRWSVMDYQCLLQADDPARKCAFNDDGSVDTAAGGAGIITSIPRDLNDTFGLRLGGSWWVRPEIEAFAGISYDSNAVPDETLESSLMDADKGLFSIGSRMQLLDKLALTATFTHIAYARRSIDPRPRGGDGEPLIQGPSRNPDGAGNYRQRLELLTLGAEYVF